ncbi:MAG: hypothetical protein NW217_10490 [Hyphomicrobiaceae bacterium]|nr:hypothetical protein [Hyphomicrobiaceae bacterium]
MKRPRTVLKRIFSLLVAFPVALLLITLAVVNRHTVRLVLDPFTPEAPVISVALPFYAYLFGALTLGVLAGGAAVWLNQGRWRYLARLRTQEAKRWQAEADRLTREREAESAGAKTGRTPTRALVAAGR